MNTATEPESSQSVATISREQRTDRVLEIIMAIILGIVAVATAWSGYQAARWGGVQSTLYSRAGALRTESVRAANEGLIEMLLDVDIFTQWVNAESDDNEPLADFYSTRFRPEFKPAFAAWLTTDPFNNPEAPNSPFVMSEYVVSSMAESDALEEEAGQIFEQGQAANEQADKYVFTAVILASVLFFAGIASGFDWVPVQIAVVAIAAILMGWGLFNLMSYPVN